MTYQTTIGAFEQPDELRENTIMYQLRVLLEEYPDLRNSDKQLYDAFYRLVEHVTTNFDQIKTPPATLDRYRRLLQARYPELKASEGTTKAREALQNQWKEEMRNGIIQE